MLHPLIILLAHISSLLWWATDVFKFPISSVRLIITHHAVLVSNGSVPYL
jgi:hypothetical protein